MTGVIKNGQVESGPGPSEHPERSVLDAVSDDLPRFSYRAVADDLTKLEGKILRGDKCTDRDAALVRRAATLCAIINHPITNNFVEGVRHEAAHQVGRWGAEHDAGKTAWDWFWLMGYLAQKAATAAAAGDEEKALHHTISTAAACLNWHAQIQGKPFDPEKPMRPGIEVPAEVAV